MLHKITQTGNLSFHRLSGRELLHKWAWFEWCGYGDRAAASVRIRLGLNFGFNLSLKSSILLHNMWYLLHFGNCLVSKKSFLSFSDFKYECNFEKACLSVCQNLSRFWNCFFLPNTQRKFCKKGKKLIPFLDVEDWCFILNMQFKIFQYQSKIIIKLYQILLLIWFCGLNILFESKYGSYNFSPKIRIKPWCGLPLKCLVCSSSVWVLKLRNLNVTFVDTFT